MQVCLVFFYQYVCVEHPYSRLEVTKANQKGEDVQNKHLYRCTCILWIYFLFLTLRIVHTHIFLVLLASNDSNPDDPHADLFMGLGLHLMLNWKIIVADDGSNTSLPTYCILLPLVWLVGLLYLIIYRLSHPLAATFSPIARSPPAGLIQTFQSC